MNTAYPVRALRSQLIASGSLACALLLGMRSLVAADGTFANLTVTGSQSINSSPSLSAGVLQVIRGNIAGGSPATSGTTDPNQIAQFGNGAVSYRMGLYQSGALWLQPSWASNFGNSYDTMLNPIGGAVGIGIESMVAYPSAKLALYSPNNNYLYVDSTLGQQSAIALSDSTNGRDVVLYRPSTTRDFAIWTPTAGNVFAIKQTGEVSFLTVPTIARAAIAPLDFRPSDDANVFWRVATSSVAQGGGNFTITNASTSLDAITITPTGRVIVKGQAPVSVGAGEVQMGGGRIMVGGTISAKEIKVTTTGADYVFADDYQLRTLDEVERFISDKKHLPEMMPAAQMQAEGMPVSEVVTKQLAKIEELTLYAIAADKKTEAVRQENRELKERLALIERMLGIGNPAK